ncbi:hypothetical protein GGG87_03635 [Streptococcus sp. zg-86]|uniref:Uncharacterized protein n=2 Tax=Streptococcus zhangguiae TaxID=2664091 RepID=A0A6I4RT78_9STRE|nr:MULTISPECIES: hypothetical protein [unclassified Streptococcus]MTB64094.1 hypothetical protein [Streptococcus sp. zg-86]MTB90580.1 hypothetical protein [Streptococcus sp. zg-36]MWV56082.1 hypothetical protein [Streptococcus sp. zg-70]QTH48289.1 hypothetical protein J5M87_02885 [Streptococcus sp. zg-86]
MSSESEKRITLHISGEAMDDEKGYELKYLIKSLQNFEKLSQKTYLFLTNQNRMTTENSEDFRVYIADIRPGSFQADVILFCQTYILPLVPMVGDHGDLVWECILNSFDFLKRVSAAKREGKSVQIENNGDKAVVVVNNGNDVTVNYYEYPNYVPELGKQLAPNFAELAKVINPKVETVNFASDLGELTLDSENANLFKKRSYLTEETFEIVGEITVLNSHSYTGKIKISDNQSFDEDEYNFEVAKDLRYPEFLQSGVLHKVSYICCKKIVFDPTSPLREKIVGVKILEKL